MEITTLEGLPLSTIAKTFNKAFSDYSIPINYTDKIFEYKVLSEGIDLKYSVGAFIDGKLAGFILHGVDIINEKKCVFNAGTGVVPQQRGQRIVDKLYDHILPRLAVEGYSHHRLEVVEGNDKAEKIYEAKGFSRMRKVTAFKGTVSTRENNSVTICEVKSLDWAVAESFWNVQPTWQNSTQCILRAPGFFRIFKAEVDGAFAGYAVAEKHSGRLKQFAVKPGHRRRGVASALFKKAANEKGEVSFINYDESDSESIAFFKAAGLKPVVSLYEMTMEYND